MYPQITILERDQGSPILAALFDVKERSHQLINRLLPSPQSALLTGILLGIDNDLPPEVRDAFNQTGTSHIIAISGANITVVAGLLFAIFGRFTDKRIAAVLMIAGIAIYTLFVGASPSVVRAAIMGVLSILAQRFGRPADGLTALAASVWFMTILNPATLFDVGLILSAFATLGLILYTGPLTKLAESIINRLFAQGTSRHITTVISDVVLITLAAQITVLPIIFLIFGRFSAASFLTNILIVPVQPPIMSLGIAAVALGTIWFPLGQIAAWIVGILLSFTLAVVRSTAQLPGASVPISVEPATILAYYVILFGMTAILSQPPEDRRVLLNRLREAATVPAIGLFGLAIGALLWAQALSRPDGKLHVWFLAVGEGNAVLIQTPQGAHLLIDGGENPTRLRTALGDRLPFFKNEIDVLFITQPRPSTIAALPPLFDRYTVKAVLTNGQSAKDETYRALATRLDTLRLKVNPITAGYRLTTDDGITIEALHPFEVPDGDVKLGDAPLVLHLAYGDASFLLTSDASEDVLQSILDSGQYPGATVLQLPSHGRVNPGGWIRASTPQVAVIEADEASRNARPGDDLAAHLRDGLRLYRTDQHGTIEIATDGKQLWISAARP